MNIIILAGAKTSESDSYPSYLTEINHSPLIQILSELFIGLEGSKVIIPVNSEDDKRYNISNSLEQILNSPTVVVCNKTKGALLSALMCIDEIDLDQALLVLNGNEYLNCDVVDVVASFASSGFDAGLVCFDSIHPRYSHAIIQDKTVEKVVFNNTAGSKACTGLVWFKYASDFFSASCTTVLKQNPSDTDFYFNSVVNQMILSNKRVFAHQIDSHDYYPLKGPSDIVGLRELLKRNDT